MPEKQDQNPDPDIVIVWDTSLVSAQEYAELVAALGDLVRSCSGKGIELISARTLVAKHANA